MTPVLFTSLILQFFTKSNCKRIFDGIIAFERNRYWNLLQDDKTGELYSSKFQFHVIELSKLKSTKGKAKKQEVYRWAKLISASTWEEVREDQRGDLGFFNERYNDRDVRARKNLRDLISSDSKEDKKG